jgi:hypothetical protein
MRKIRIPKGREIVVVKIHGRTRKLSSLSESIRNKLFNGELVARTGVKIGNKIEWI